MAYTAVTVWVSFVMREAAGRRFRYEVEGGDSGASRGVAAPAAFFPFGNWEESSFGTL